jgi:hypothetical protein
MRGGARGSIITAIIFVMITILYVPAAYAAGAETPTTDVTNGTGAVDVAEIEIDDHKDVVTVDETLELAVTVLPQNATEQTVSYESSDEKVLTVDSKGKVKGISPGNAVITVSVGGLTRRVAIRVREATGYIDVDADYLVLKKGETRVIRAKAVPDGASQDISFKSLNPKVARVTKTGVIKARATGSASILVSNEDLSVGITVIVNRGSAAPGGGKDKTKEAGDGTEEDEETTAEYAAFVADMDKTGRASVRVSEYPVLTSEMLVAIYSAGAQVELAGPDYSLYISAGDIINTGNELSAGISFVKTPDGVEFLLNRGLNLPGRVRLAAADGDLLKKYVYLYNNAKKKYELLDVKDGDSLMLDSGGKYLMTDEKTGGFGINRFLVGIAVAAIAVMIVIFIIVKRRYWFW